MAASNHYVNNTELTNAIIAYQELLKENPKLRVPDFIGSSIIKISCNLAHKPNFSGYPFKEEMIGDGIENCIRYINNFNKEKSTNAFSYFTQIIYYAFLRRILREKKQLYVKNKLISNSYTEFFSVDEEDDQEYANAFVEYLKANNSFDGSVFEKKTKSVAKKLNIPTLEEFMKDVDGEVVE